MIRIYEVTNQYTLTQVQEIIENAGKGVQLILYIEKKAHLQWVSSISLSSNITIITEEHRKQIFEQENFGFHYEFSDVIQKVVRDENIYLMKDRGEQRYHQYLPYKISNYHFNAIIATVAFRQFLLYKKIRPDYILFASTPHNTESWIHALVADAMGIKIILLHRSFLYGWVKAAIGLGRTPKAIPINNHATQEERDYYFKALENYLRKLRSTYADAIPEYEKKRFKRNNGKYLSLPHIIRKNWKRPSWILMTYMCWRSLKNLSVNIKSLGSKKYVIFFLHYQPERTTLPEGYGFTHQINIVLALRSCLPENIQILVKEHPSTFTSLCHLSFRHPFFYKTIANIKGVNWVDISTDNFDLVDKAICTATVTGTIGVESLARGVPVVYFGVPVRQNTYGQHVYHCGEALYEFLKKACNEEFLSSKIKTDLDENVNDDQVYSFKDNLNEKGRPAKVFVLKKITNHPELLSE